MVFSDYDADVLERYTRVDAARVGGQCFLRRRLARAARGVEGDGFGKFELILSAETAYREDTTPVLWSNASRGRCRRPARPSRRDARYYFGCGGGVAPSRMK